MQYCPYCGTRTEGSTDCDVCSGGTEANLVTDGGQGPNDPRDNQPNQPPGNNQPQGSGEQPQGGQGRQPQGQQPRGQQQGYNQQGQQPRGNQRRGPPQRGNDGFSRRQLLLGGGGAVALAGGGWFFFLRDDGDPTGSPDAAVESYFEALGDGNFERAAELTHPDGPERGGASVDTLAQSFEGIFAEINVTVESTEIVDEDIPYNASNYDNVEEFETVRAESTLEEAGGGGSRTTTEIVVVARDSNGEWRVWESGR